MTPARWEAPVAALGTAFVLAAVTGALAPIAGASEVAGAVIALVLGVAAAVVAATVGSPERPRVQRVAADVCSAAAAFYLGSAAGELAAALGPGGSAPTLVGGGVALAYAVPAQRRRPGPFAAAATAVAVVVASVSAVGLADDDPAAAYAAVLCVDAAVLAAAGALRVLSPSSAMSTTAALSGLAAASALLGADAGAGAVTMAVLLLAVVALGTVVSREPSVVAALAAGAPVVVPIALWRTGHGWWSIPLGLAWSGAGVALIGALTTRHRARRDISGVLAWCTSLVLVAALFLTNSTRLHALIALACAAALFAAGAAARRTAVTVLAGLTVLSAVSRAVTDRSMGNALLLVAGAALLYVAMSRRGRERAGSGAAGGVTDGNV